MPPTSITGIRIRIKSELRWFASARALMDRPDRQEAFLARASDIDARMEVVYRCVAELTEMATDKDSDAVLASEKDLDQCQQYADDMVQRRMEILSARSTGGDKAELPSYSGIVSRLPSIELPVFDGDLNQWVGFINLFDSLVHDRRDLTASYKMAQLRGALRGEPGELVAHLPVTEDSYLTARQILFDRYQNERRLVDAQLSRIFAMPYVARASDIRKDILNPMTTATKALANLGLPIDQWSYILFFIVLGRLPVDLQTRFEQQRTGAKDGLPTLAELLSFLEEECRRADNMTVGPHPSGPRDSRRGHVISGASRGGGRTGPTQRLHALVAQAELDRCCSYCRESGHDVTRCDRFGAQRVQGRRNIVRQRGWCFMCLGPHMAQQCPRPRACTACNGRHHDILCLNRPGMSQQQQGLRSPVREQPQPVGRRSPPGGSARRAPSDGRRGQGPAHGRLEERPHRGAPSHVGPGGLTPGNLGPNQPYYDGEPHQGSPAYLAAHATAPSGKGSWRGWPIGNAAGGCQWAPMTMTHAGVARSPPCTPPCPSACISPPLMERPRLEPLPPVYGRYGHSARTYIRRDGKRSPYVGAWDPLAQGRLPPRASRGGGDSGPQ